MNPSKYDYFQSKLEGIFEYLGPCFESLESQIEKLITELKYEDARLESVKKLVDLIRLSDSDMPVLNLLNILERIVTLVKEYNDFSAKQ